MNEVHNLGLIFLIPPTNYPKSNFLEETPIRKAFNIHPDRKPQWLNTTVKTGDFFGVERWPKLGDLSSDTQHAHGTHISVTPTFVQDKQADPRGHWLGSLAEMESSGLS